MLTNFSSFLNSFTNENPYHYASIMNELSVEKALFEKTLNEQFIPTVIELLSMLIINEKPLIKGLFKDVDG